MENFESLLSIKDLWSHLAGQHKPIVLYGMGDGADKILNVCGEKGITVSGVFASDEFVRGQLFRGYTVKTFSAVKEEFGDVVVLVSFATRLADVMERIYGLCDENEVYAPDVPVFGDGLFDSKYFAENFDKFNAVFSMLDDDVSKITYYNVIAYKLTGDLKYLRECETSVDEAYSGIIMPTEKSVYIDIGAYNGDTLTEYVSFAGKDITAYAFEPDERNFRKLTQTAEGLDLSEVKLYNVAAWNKKEELTFYSRSGRNSAHTTSHSGLKSKQINADRVDNYISHAVDFINIDAEGSDLNALEGLSDTIRKYKPTISCAVYHRNEDMFAIPLYLAEKYGSFKMYIRHFPYIPAWDTNIYIKSNN